MPRQYAITAESVAAERERVGGDLSKVDVARVVTLDSIELRDVGAKDVKMKVLAVSGEHNVDHAALADTVNIAELRGGKMFPGNSALGEVTAVGSDVSKFKAGDIVITHCIGKPDDFGYPLRIWAYDMPDSIGWYGEEAVVEEWQLIKAPLDCGLNLWEIAALPLRAPTAYHLWRRGIGMYRVKVTEQQQPKLNVLSFGGGVGELFLMLAKAEGHNAYFCSGSAERRQALEKLGIEGIDQMKFNRFADRSDNKAFVAECKERTGGVGMHIVCDMLRGPVFAAGLACQARMGVNVSAGWQLNKAVDYDSAGASTKQLTIDHTHYDTLQGCEEATALYGKVFKPTLHHEIYSFDDLPRAMMEMQAATQTGIPIIRMTDDMPDAVKDLLD